MSNEADEVDPSDGAVADRIVLTAMRRDPGLDEQLARRFAGIALEQVQDGVEVGDAPELARRLLVTDPSTGASAASVVAAATADVLSGSED